MSPYAVGFLTVNAVAILVLPRRWALLPLLVGSCYMTVSQHVEIGSLTFTVLRLLIFVAFLRIAVRGERFLANLNVVDKLVIGWGVWGVFVSLLHPMPSDFTLVTRLGLVYDIWGMYFLIRIFCATESDVRGIIQVTALLLVPVAVEMLMEKMTGTNSFSGLGGVPHEVLIRDGVLRAQGPFRHPILAGTVGAVCLPLMIGIWRKSVRFAIIGASACITMVLTSASSGPLASMIFGIGALLLWRYRKITSKLRWAAVVLYLGLEIVMNRPAYYILTYANLTGSSAGWHRARLIESAFSHINEWWLAGTNYTRHWMPSGVSWSPNHTDITNYYLDWGIKGGLMWMLLYISILAAAFVLVGRTIRICQEKSDAENFFVWSLGASLFAHVLTCISVSYFDQSFLFIILTVAAISSLYSASEVFAQKKRMAPGQDRDQAPSA